MFSFDDRGTLTVSDNGLTFTGGLFNFTVQRITKVTYGYYGWDWVNKWIRIDYVVGEVPYAVWFKDGGALGWRGVFGGTEKLKNSIMNGIEAQSGSLQPVLVNAQAASFGQLQKVDIARRTGTAKVFMGLYIGFLSIAVVLLLIVLGLFFNIFLTALRYVR